MRGLLRSGNTNSLGLIDAAQNGDIERVKAKLKAGKDVNSRDEARFEKHRAPSEYAFAAFQALPMF